MWIQDFINLIFPRICCGCGNNLWKHEKVICDLCFHHLPRTGFHLFEDNPVHQIFRGRTDILGGASFLLFNKGSKVRNLIHSLKYKGRKDVGVFLGKEFGKELRACSPFNECDLIIPVPLHRKKYLKRGYNQSEEFAAGLSEDLAIPYLSKCLMRRNESETQTHKSRLLRWKNVSGAFYLNRDHLPEGSRILLVDDVITTGATLEACIAALKTVPGISVAVATIAYARL